MRFVNPFSRKTSIAPTDQTMANSQSELMVEKAAGRISSKVRYGIFLVCSVAVISTAVLLFRQHRQHEENVQKEYVELKTELQQGLMESAGVDLDQVKRISVMQMEDGYWAVSFELKQGGAITRMAKMENGKFMWKNTDKEIEMPDGSTVQKDSIAVDTGAHIRLNAEIGSRDGAPINKEELQDVIKNLPRMLLKTCQATGTGKEDVEHVRIIFIKDGKWEVTFYTKSGDEVAFDVSIEKDGNVAEKKQVSV